MLPNLWLGAADSERGRVRFGQENNTIPPHACLCSFYLFIYLFSFFFFALSGLCCFGARLLRTQASPHMRVFVFVFVTLGSVPKLKIVFSFFSVCVVFRCAFFCFFFFFFSCPGSKLREVVAFSKAAALPSDMAKKVRQHFR